MNSFDAKSLVVMHCSRRSLTSSRHCDSRKYTYIFPSHALLPPKPGTALHAQLAAPTHPFWSEDSADDDQRRKQQWRVPAEQVDALRATLARYHGTHNFHNFTVGKEFGDRTTQRFIKGIEVRNPHSRDARV